MSQRTVTKCNQCQIAKETASFSCHDGWLALRNIDLPSAINNRVRLNEEHHFCSIKCLRIWALKAEAAGPKLVRAAENLHPRRTFSNDELGLQY